ncbi:MAG: indolepyruvate oxidoreductase subunit beta [Synergistaceae bacterium]|nr:indolepyruvate oxidoreductase subunit beta [Synergistaceae bacterium]
MATRNIMIVGVGGQGSVLASKLLGNLLTAENFDVKVSEVHGMSQRGGSVVTYVKYGDKVYSPVVEKGEADFIVSFEILETARWLEYLKPDGQIVTSTQQVDPMPVLTGAMTYPENLLEKIKATGVKAGAPLAVDALDCLKLAEQAGSSKAVNLVLLGRLSHYFNDIKPESWQKAIEACVPPKFLELNKKAFELGKASRS